MDAENLSLLFLLYKGSVEIIHSNSTEKGHDRVMSLEHDHDYSQILITDQATFLLILAGISMSSIMIILFVHHPFPSSGMHTQEYLSIKEAAERYSKAEITIRRFVRNVLQKASSHERKLIRPRPDEAMKLKKRKRPFAYTINSALLSEKFSDESAPKVGKHTEIPPAEYMSLLQRTNTGLLEQMKVKDDQIKALNSTLESLSERQRETNVLMKILEERLLLPSPEQAQRAAKKRWWKPWRKK